jgi:hypothetical protein
MKIHNYCTECGKPINNILNKCPYCGADVDIDTIAKDRSLEGQKSIETGIIPHTGKRKTPTIKKFGFFSWILLLIGSTIGLYCLSTPAGSIRIGDTYSWDMWMFGYNIIFESGVGYDIFWTVNQDLLTVSLTSTTFVIIGNVAAIVSAVLLIKNRVTTMGGAMVAPLVLIGSSLFYLGGYQVLMFFGTGESFWSLMNPAFAVYGQFLAAGIMILGFLIARGASKYAEPVEKEVHQEKVFNMLKKIVESKPLIGNEKERLNKELEVISFRLKGTALLQKKIEILNEERPEKILSEETELKQGLKLFEQALELSSNSQLEISEIDLNLVKVIVEQQDISRALHYLNEISDHTTILIGEVLKRLSL